MDKIIKTGFIPDIPLDTTISSKPIYLSAKFIPGKHETIVNLSNNEEKYTFSPINLYRLNVILTEKVENPSYEKDIIFSDSILFYPKIGQIKEAYIQRMHKEKFRTKKLLSKSEKDNINYVIAAKNIMGMHSLLNKKDIKKFTYENRGYKNIDEFVDSKFKVSKLLTENRKKKVLFSVQSKMHFEDKIEEKNKEENKFMGNEWFMGPIYSYDYNYNKYT